MGGHIVCPRGVVEEGRVTTTAGKEAKNHATSTFSENLLNTKNANINKLTF